MLRRRAAPGPLALVQEFANTRFDLAAEDHGETFTDPEAMASWLASRGLLAEGKALGEKDLSRAINLREGLRALAFANNGHALATKTVSAMREASRGLRVEVRLEPDGPELVDGDTGDLDVALGRLLAIAAQANVEGTWQRFKACPGRDCGWVFFDHSRNASSRWCSMKVCGSREKARAHYWRTAGKPRRM